MSEQRIAAVVEDETLKALVNAAANGLGYSVEYAVSPATREDIIAWLVNLQPALIVVDMAAQGAQWQPWVITAKTSPSTRRIPIIAVGQTGEEALFELARQSGANAVVYREEFTSDVAGWIQKVARKADQDRAELLRQAALPPSDQLLKGIHEFNAGAYFEQHETLEAAWRAESGPIRQLYQGILQIGVAYYQIQRRNYAGAIKMFQRAWQYLDVLPDVSQGVNVAELRADARVAQMELERLGPERIAEFNPVLLRPVQVLKRE